MAREHVGLVIRQGAVEVAVLSGGLLGGATLLRQARIPLPAPRTEELQGSARQAGVAAGSADQPAEQDERVIQAIRDALAACQISSGAKVAVAVPAKDVLLRCFTLPLLPRVEWERAIQFEARKYIPFKIDQLIWNYHVIEHRAAKQMTVLFTGLRTELYARVQGWLSAAGVTPMLLEGVSASLARAVGAERVSSKDAFIAAVDVESDSAHIIITRSGVPYLSRELSLTGSVESRAAARDSEEQRRDVLVSELRLSLEFFAREQAGAVIERVLLFGEQHTLSSWCAGLSEQLSVRVEVGALPVKAAQMSMAPLEYAAAAGVALGGLRGGRPPLELLARAAAPRSAMSSPSALLAQSPQLVKALARPVAIQLGVALGVLACMGVVTHRQVADANARASRVVRTVPDVGWGLQATARPELETRQQQINVRLGFLRAATQQRVFVVEKLDALAKLLPDGVWLEQVEYQDKLEQTGRTEPSLVIRGACFLPGEGDSLRAVSTLLQRLKQDAGLLRGFATAQISQTMEAMNPTRRYAYRTFQLNCQAERRAF